MLKPVPSFQIERARKTHLPSNRRFTSSNIETLLVCGYSQPSYYSRCLVALESIRHQDEEARSIDQCTSNHFTTSNKEHSFPNDRNDEAASAKGAYGTKIVGSGGGGCFVALCSQDSTTNVIKAIETAGARKAFSVNITSSQMANPRHLLIMGWCFFSNEESLVQHDLDQSTFK